QPLLRVPLEHRGRGTNARAATERHRVVVEDLHSERSHFRVSVGHYRLLGKTRTAVERDPVQKPTRHYFSGRHVRNAQRGRHIVASRPQHKANGRSPGWIVDRLNRTLYTGRGEANRNIAVQLVTIVIII